MMGHGLTASGRPYSCRRMAARFIAAYAIPLWITAGFTLMGITAFFASAPAFIRVWPPLFFAIAALSALSVWRPDAPRVAAAAGALLAVVGVARIVAVADFYSPVLGAPNATLHVLLWGLHVIVGLRWPNIIYEADLRHTLDESKNHPKEPDYADVVEG